ncbi:MAG TPA: hypothetical protein VG474_04980 [Solirubrobacteraceae bacterium]|nr:hypothetical protein [Solirubrobacteraceae bacterium]
MSPDNDGESFQETGRAIERDVDQERARLDELGEHIDEAAKKAQTTRDQADPESDEKVAETIGEWSDEAPREDDPAGAVDDPQDDGRED